MNEHKSDDKRGVALGIAALAVIACCLAPVLVASGAIAVGGVLANPLLIAAGILLGTFGLATALSLHRSSKGYRVREPSNP